jgi:Uma2 family endonuclease
MAIRAPARPARSQAEPPALESGMRLNAEEFDRRYALQPDLRAELVQGVVYVSSPVSIDHSEPDSMLIAWLRNYAAGHRAVRCANNSTVLLSADDRVQPDAMLWRRADGTARVNGKYVEGAPELAVEIAVSSASYDLNVKKESYRRAGVQEYVVWVIEDEQINWFALENGSYVELAPGEDGWTSSRVFPGLRLHTERLLAGDESVILPGAI